ncbi:MAG TPA: GNAT family N-acetyltransferase [Bacillota bacterium]|nr:GNAT family N-acetyltransferase [Bacillota bacterium]
MDHSPNLLIQEEIMIKRISTDKEKEEAQSVRTNVFVEEQKVPRKLETDELDEAPSTIHFVGYYKGQPVGAARLRLYQDKIGKIERVAILSPVRGIGLGAFLMKRIEEEAKLQGFHKLKLNAQLHAAPFYTKLGYRAYGDIFMDADIEHIAMEKELDII